MNHMFRCIFVFYFLYVSGISAQEPSHVPLHVPVQRDIAADHVKSSVTPSTVSESGKQAHVLVESPNIIQNNQNGPPSNQDQAHHYSADSQIHVQNNVKQQNGETTANIQQEHQSASHLVDNQQQRTDPELQNRVPVAGNERHKEHYRTDSHTPVAHEQTGPTVIGDVHPSQNAHTNRARESNQRAAADERRTSNFEHHRGDQIPAAHLPNQGIKTADAAFQKPPVVNPSVNSHPQMPNPGSAAGRRDVHGDSLRNMHPNDDHDRNPHHRHVDDERRSDPFKQGAHDHPPPRRRIEPGRRKVHPEFQLDEVYSFPSLRHDELGQLTTFPVLKFFMSITAIVAPGVKDCFFYTPITNFLVDYQVIKGGQQDVGLFVKDPDGEPIAAKHPLPESSVQIAVPDHFRYFPYAVCLDNRKASYGEKHVYLSIDIDVNWDHPSDAEKLAIDTVRARAESETQMESALAQIAENVQTLNTRLDSIFARLRKVEHLQQRSNNLASSDRALMEANLELVTRGSVFQVLLLTCVAVFQVFFIRALFDEHSYLHRLCFGGKSGSAPTSARC